MWRGDKTDFSEQKKLTEMTTLTCENSCQKSKGQPDKSQAKQIVYSSWNGIKIEHTTAQESSQGRLCSTRYPKMGRLICSVLYALALALLATNIWTQKLSFENM